MFNTLASVGCGFNFKRGIYEHMSRIKFMGRHFLQNCSQVNDKNSFDDKSTLFQVNGLVPTDKK